MTAGRSPGPTGAFLDGAAAVLPGEALRPLWRAPARGALPPSTWLPLSALLASMRCRAQGQAAGRSLDVEGYGVADLETCDHETHHPGELVPASPQGQHRPNL